MKLSHADLMILNSKPGGGEEQALNVALLVKTSFKKNNKTNKKKTMGGSVSRVHVTQYTPHK